MGKVGLGDREALESSMECDCTGKLPEMNEETGRVESVSITVDDQMIYIQIYNTITKGVTRIPSNNTKNLLTNMLCIFK